MRELLSRGIGVHHGGLLPIVKEVRARVVSLSSQPTVGTVGRGDPLRARLSQDSLRYGDFCDGEQWTQRQGELHITINHRA